MHNLASLRLTRISRRLHESERSRTMNRLMTATGVAVLTACVATVSAQQEVAAPFGVRMGAARQELTIANEVSGAMVKLTSVPRPHPDMESYIVQVTPQAGVCWVKAMGKTVTTSVYGEGVRRVFHDLETQLNSVYGPAEEHDDLGVGSIWDEPRDYMMGLHKRERELSAVWHV